MEFITYEPRYKNQVIALVLYLQNFENRIDSSLEEQPDMADIEGYYLETNGGFWLAINDQGDVVGTMGLLNKGVPCGVLKKFFVHPDFRGREHGVSQKLYHLLLDRAAELGMTQIVLDTPPSCTRAHGFYLREGFEGISKDQVPVQYSYPDRGSLFFLKNL